MYDHKHVKAKVIEGPNQKDVVAAILGWMFKEPSINVFTIVFGVSEVERQATVFYESL